MSEGKLKLLQAADFDFDIPKAQIAQFPLQARTQSRLLVVGNQEYRTREIQFSELAQLLRPGDLVVCNDTKVIPARFFGRKPTGGRIEFLIERLVNDHCFLAQAKARRKLRIGEIVTVNESFQVTVRARQREFFILDLSENQKVQDMIEICGHVPLPPYIKRSAEQIDLNRYQCVYAKHSGSVAAPTAGLHFSLDLIRKIKRTGVEFAYVTLHVGAGTFAPIRSVGVKEHKLHSERYCVSDSVVEAVRQAQKRGSRVVAVGTTVMRALESASRTGKIQPRSAETDLFITPGFNFQTVDALITNFHLPRSSLIMLVSAFGGTNRILEAYRFAIDRQFRFYSYGDAMFVEPG